MNLSRNPLVGIALAGLMLSGCTSQVTEKEQYSGFLPSYNNLEEVTTTSGEKAMRWISPSWNPNAYDTVFFTEHKASCMSARTRYTRSPKPLSRRGRWPGTGIILTSMAPTRKALVSST